MKKALLLFFLPVILALAGANGPFARAETAPDEAQAGSSKDAAPHRSKKNRKKSVKKAAVEADAARPAEAAPGEEAPKPRGKKLPKEPLGSVSAGKPVLKTLDTRKANSLIYGTMEKLETLIALNDNLRLQVPEDTFNKAAELERACNKAAADFFKTEEPDPGREAVKSYKNLLASAIDGLRILKDVKDRVIPEDTEKALALCKDLNAAIEGELSGAKLKAGTPAETPQEETRAAATVTEPSAPAETALSGEAGALATLSELRKAVEAYKAGEGKYPKKLNKVTPKYLPEMPAISVADHTTTDEVLEIESEDYDDSLHQAITDSGKWLYFTAKKSRYYGRVFIDCSHKNAKGVELYKAGEGK